MDRGMLKTWINTKGEEIFSRSGGPGGQHINKVSTKVTLKLPVENIPGITETELELLRTRLGNKINNEGELVIQASDERSQSKNRRRAEERAMHLILEGSRRDKKRRATKPGKAAKERRLARKKKRSRLKQYRKKPEADS
jgi:ribosome-associated protein